MTDLRFDVPVVAHRFYGTRYIERLSRIAPRVPNINGIGPSHTVPYRGTGPVLYPAINRDHGTTTSVEAIRAIFTEDLDVAGSDGLSVNSYWEPMGIRFVLLGIVDEAIDNHLADFIPNDARYFKGLFEPIMRKGRVAREAIHMMFVRNLEGRTGNANSASKYKSAHVLLEDFWSIPGETPEQRWSRWMGTVVHEFGHALNLSHTGDRENVMWFYQTSHRQQIKATQMRIAQEEASSYSLPPETPDIAPYLGVDEGLRIRL